MEQNNSVVGRQDADLSGVLGSIQNGGENNVHQGAAAALAAGAVGGGAGVGPSGVATVVAAGGDRTEYAAAVAADGPRGYAASGPSGVADAGVPSGVAAGGGPREFAALDALAALAATGSPRGYTASGPSGVADAGVPSGVAAGGGPSEFAALDALAALAATGSPRGYTANGPSGVADACVPSGIADAGGLSEFAALDALAALAAAGGPNGYTASGPSGVAAAGVPSAVAGTCYESATGKRKRNHRHSDHQINAMEAYFKNDPHPSPLQRNQLAMSLGLDDAQVQYWFQNKRTQVKNQSDNEENHALQTENDMLRSQKQQLIEALRKNTCPRCTVGSSRQTIERNNLRLENSHLIKEVESLKSTIIRFTVGQNKYDPRNLLIIPQNQQNLPVPLNDPHNLSIIYENRQNLPIVTVQNRESIPIISQNLQNLPSKSNTGNANSYPIDLGQGHASTGKTSFGEGVHSINVPTSHDFRKSLNELVVLAAEELKVMSMFAGSLWISSSVDGASDVLNEVEYHSTFPDNFGPIRLGYTCEASRHTSRVLMKPTELLNILMDANKWAFTFSDIVSEALTLDVPSEGVNLNAAVQVMAAEYHLPTPLVPNRGTYFARYCTQHSEGVWAVVDVSIDKILPTPESMTCQKRPSGCLIQGMSDGTSKITWIEHVYVDYTGVRTIYKRLLRSGLGFGAKRWVSILERQCQRIVSANVPSRTHDFNNLVMFSPEGRRGILMLAERMVKHFIFGITGPRTGKWTKVQGNFGNDVRLMSTRAMEDPGLASGTWLSVATSFVLSLAPNIVFNYFRDYRHRKEWDICANGNEYEAICRIPYGEEPSNCVSIYKVMVRQQHMLELQDCWSDPVASHVVFASTEIGTIDAILGGCDPNGLPLMPYGFTILPNGPSSPVDGSSGTLLTVSFQVLINRSPTANIDFAATAKVAQFLQCNCEKIKLALGAISPRT